MPFAAKTVEDLKNFIEKVTGSITPAMYQNAVRNYLFFFLIKIANFINSDYFSVNKKSNCTYRIYLE